MDPDPDFLDLYQDLDSGKKVQSWIRTKGPGSEVPGTVLTLTLSAKDKSDTPSPACPPTKKN